MSDWIPCPPRSLLSMFIANSKMSPIVWLAVFLISSLFTVYTILTSLLYFDLFDVIVTSSMSCSNVLCADVLL